MKKICYFCNQVFTEEVMKIGPHIKEVLFSQHHTAKWLAEQIHCERTNVYDIFRRDDVSVKLLARISVVLDHDFFAELSKEAFPAKSKK